jgi:hypothetical protein
MDRKTRSPLAAGLILIVLGVFFLVIRIVPSLTDALSWPFIVIGMGIVFMAIALVANSPGLAVPACILGGIGGILAWQNAAGAWWTWSYVWALIPGFVGVGIIVSGLLEGRLLKAVLDGMWPILIGLLLFFVFGSFFGGLPWFGSLWGFGLIAVGILILLRPLARGGRRAAKQDTEGQST